MKTSEILSQKIQTLLGSNYHIFSDTHFNRNYTEAREVREGENIGYARFTTAEYGKFRKDKVVGILSVTNFDRANSNVMYVDADFKIEFSVPRNVVKTTKNNEVLSEPSFNFDDDIETLINAVTNKNIQFTIPAGQSTITYNGRINIDEPTFLMTEGDGEYQYDIYSVIGTADITDNAYFGSGYKVELYLSGAYVELDDINSFTTQMNEDANAILKSGKIKTEKNVGQSNWVCTVSIDDYVSTNAARQFIYSCVHTNKEILNATATNEALKRKQRVRITTPHGYVHTFNSIMTIDFGTTENGVGSYAISFTDDNKDITQHTLFFDANGGSDVASKSVIEGQLIGALPVPIREGYTLSGWKIGNTPITANMTYNYIDDATATAVWVGNEYTIFYDANGGTGTMEIQTANYGDTITLKTNAYTYSHTVNGVTYTANFLGWSKNKNAKTPTYTDAQQISNLASEGLITLYAVWENYYIRFRVQGFTIFTSINKIYGDLLGILPTAPSIPTLTFSGWYVDDELISASTPYKWSENVVAEARYS